MTLLTSKRSDVHKFMEHLARESGKIIMEQYGKASTTKKEDGSVLTPVDLQVEAYVRNELAREAPSIPLLSEESPESDLERRLQSSELFILDPLDGTQEYAQGPSCDSKDFSFMLAHLRNNRPVASIVFQPAQYKGHGRFFIGGDDYAPVYVEIDGNWKDLMPFDYICKMSPPARLSPEERAAFKVGHSVNYKGPKFEAVYSALGIPAGSSRLVLGGGIGGRMMQVAMGETHLIPAYTGKGVKEWDTAAAEPILRGLGYSITDIHGNDLTYNKPDPRHTQGVLVAHPDLRASALEAMARAAAEQPL